MSRSYKKAVFKDSGRSKTKKFWKRQANKKVRRRKKLNGRAGLYKRLYNSWIICDFRSDSRFTQPIYEPQTIYMKQCWHIPK